MCRIHDLSDLSQEVVTVDVLFQIVDSALHRLFDVLNFQEAVQVVGCLGYEALLVTYCWMPGI